MHVFIDLPPAKRGPAWDIAPDWARFKAQNADGSWYWFEQRPEPEQSGSWECTGRQRFGAWRDENPYGWQTTLEARP